MRVTLVTTAILCVISISICLLSRPVPSSNQTNRANSGKNVYATWDTMEFDKAVAAWLIVRYIDKNAQFAFYPVGSQIESGTPFDVPQSPWRRQHKKCAADCVLELLEMYDLSVMSTGASKPASQCLGQLQQSRQGLL